MRLMCQYCKSVSEPVGESINKVLLAVKHHPECPYLANEPTKFEPVIGS